MNYVLKSILDMDKMARAKKQDAEKYRREIYDSAEAEKNKIIKAELETARGKVDLIGEGFRKGAEKKIKVVSQQNDTVVAELYRMKQENENRWADELYERILK